MTKNGLISVHIFIVTSLSLIFRYLDGVVCCLFCILLCLLLVTFPLSVESSPSWVSFWVLSILACFGKYVVLSMLAYFGKTRNSLHD